MILTADKTIKKILISKSKGPSNLLEGYASSEKEDAEESESNEDDSESYQKFMEKSYW